jgi:hypothetical protein
MLTGITDIDIIILSYVDDATLEQLLTVNKYTHSVLQTDSLWRIKVNTLYNIPFAYKLDIFTHKKFYHVLLHKDWETLIIYADIHKHLELIKWLEDNDDYKNYFINMTFHYIRVFARLAMINSSTIRHYLVHIYLNILYNHRYLMENWEHTKIIRLQSIILAIANLVHQYYYAIFDVYPNL